MEHEDTKTILEDSGTCDIHASPGSGKTTLVCRKISILVGTWQHRHSGLAVISHTNTAASTIEDRLRESGTVLNHPHFLGTLQSFIGKYLASPHLRDRGVSPLVENDLFVRVGAEILEQKRFTGARNFLARRSQDVNSLLSTLHFRLDGTLNLPFQLAPATKTYQSLSQLKAELAQRGIFLYKDMYFFALEQLQRPGSSPTVLRQRFPVILIDEAQDFDRDQEDTLMQLFDGCIVQRFGDSDQSIFSESAKEVGPPSSFPRGTIHTLPRSHRFGDQIARAIAPFRVSAEPVIGSPSVNDLALRVLVFNPGETHRVIPRFATIAAEVFGDQAPHRQIAAIGARRNGSMLNASRIPRDIADYTQGSVRASASRIEEVLTELHAGRIDVIAAASRVLLTAAQTTRDIELARTWVESRPPNFLRLFSNAASAVHLGAAASTALTNLADACLSNGLSEVCVAGIRDGFGVIRAETPSVQNVRVQICSNGIPITLSTIHGVKGETYDAVLLLETYIANGKDVKGAFEAAGKSLRGKPSTRSDQARLRRTYVAMSRPRYLLCVSLLQSDATKTLLRFIEETLGGQIISV